MTMIFPKNIMKNELTKFLIFASPRTGSSNLTNLIGSLHNGRSNILYDHISEPFGARNLRTWYKDVLEQASPELQTLYTKGSFSQRETGIRLRRNLTRSQIIEILNICFKNSCGVKHLYPHLPILKNFSLLEYAMTKCYKIIFLTRNSNTLKDVSLQLSAQTGAWSKEEMDNKNVAYDPIDIEALKRQATQNKEHKTKFQTITCDYDIYRASYEQIFCQDNQLNEVHKIMDYLEINREELDAVTFNRSMNYDNNKQNTSSVYNKIPNIDEVIQFAKDEYDDDISYILIP